jgi:exonuclease V gamma subunit
MATIEELNQQLEDAEIEVRRHERNRGDITDEIESLVREYKRQLQNHQFASRIRAADSQVENARRVASEIQQQIDSCRIAQNQQSDIVGRTVAEWKHQVFSGGRKYLTGLRGVIEVFKKGDHFIGSKYSKPLIGSHVIRVLKGDGTRSKRCIQMYSPSLEEIRQGKIEYRLPHLWKFENE